VHASTSQLWALGLGGATVSIAAVVTASLGAPADAAFGRGLLELLIVGVPIAAGLYSLRLGATANFGVALYVIGVAWSITALGEAASSVLYTIGRLADWLIFPCAVYLLLAFPRGRVAPGLDRALMIGVVVVDLGLFYATAPLVTVYPQHTLWATCTTTCPANAIALIDRPPSVLPHLILVREWLVMLLWTGLFASMIRRWRNASPFLRRAKTPVFVAGAVLGVSHIAFHASRQLGAPANVEQDLSDVWTLCIVAVCAAIFCSLVRQRLLIGGAMRDLSSALRRSDEPAAVRDALALAVGDPSLSFIYRDPGSGDWLDAKSGPARSPAVPEPGHAVTPIADRNGHVDAILFHDVSLSNDAALLDGLGSVIVMGWLQGRAATELARSRRALVVHEWTEREQIEHDLHDGVQQFVLALRTRLTELARRVSGTPLRDDVAELVRVADATADEIRRISHGAYPPTLAQDGIASALRRLPPIPNLSIRVRDRGVGRLPTMIEHAAYFATLEAIQNAAKHAFASGVVVTLERDDAVRISIVDHGRGFDPSARGSSSGIGGLRDRIASIGGEMSVISAPGRGTTVRIAFPLVADPPTTA
jgi:signal transduction histidine kinase